MNGRKPTRNELLYITAVIELIGCIACILDGREIENPAAWTEFHHDPDYGSTKPNCHFHGIGLCVPHHRGITPAGQRLPAGFAVRHPQLSGGPRFSDVYGSDDYLCALVWERLPEDIKSVIGFDLSVGEVPGEA